VDPKVVQVITSEEKYLLRPGFEVDRASLIRILDPRWRGGVSAFLQPLCPRRNYEL